MCFRCRVAAALCGLAAAGHVAVAPLLRRTQAALDSRLCHCGRAAGRHRWRARLTGTLGWRLGPAPWTGGLDWHLASQPLHGAPRKGRLPGRAPAASQSQPTEHCCTLSTPFLSDTDAALPTVHHCPAFCARQLFSPPPPAAAVTRPSQGQVPHTADLASFTLRRLLWSASNIVHGPPPPPLEHQPLVARWGVRRLKQS